MEKNNLTASILIADDELQFREMLSSLLQAEGYTITLAKDGVEAINLLQKKVFDIVLLDIQMPRVGGLEVLTFIKANYVDTQVIILSGFDDIRIAVECMKKGAFYYLPKPCPVDELFSLVSNALERRNLTIENKVMKTELSRLARSSHLIGESPIFMHAMELAEKVAPTDSTVLIEGASGTGKELFANFIHKQSRRADKPMVVLNCSSIPDTLIESELFGHEKGAFTDAIVLKQGLVEIAHGGTIFLDEIGEISTVFQPKLLRFIQTGEYRRVGGNKSLQSDVRIISATNKNLIEEVKAGRFREDLLYRLNVITLQLPSLSQRKQDIPLLVNEVLLYKNKTNSKKKIHPDTMLALMEYDWPGNVRELENVLERAMILSNDDFIHPKELVLPSRFTSISPDSLNSQNKIGTAISIDELEKEHIAGVLSLTKWNKKLSAKILGISLKTLYTKLLEYGLKEN
jgi:two-component system, NtrC family, response regulator AtoC